MELTDVAAAQEVLQRAFGELQRQRTGRLVSPPFGPRLAQTRFQKEPLGAFVAVRGGRIVGCVFGVRWGALGWFGPLAVAPEVQGLGVAQQLVEAVHARWRRQRVRLWGLETVADSAQHVHLYGKLGYLPLSVGVSFVADAATLPPPRGFRVESLSALPMAERDAALRHLRRIAGEVIPGADPSVEIVAALESQIGDTILVSDGLGPVAFAVAHAAPMLRAPGLLAVPVAAASPRGGARAFVALLRGLRAFAHDRGIARVWIRVAGRRVRAQGLLRREGFREEGAMLRMKRGRDEERMSQLWLDSWL